MKGIDRIDVFPAAHLTLFFETPTVRPGCFRWETKSYQPGMENPASWPSDISAVANTPNVVQRNALKIERLLRKRQREREALVPGTMAPARHFSNSRKIHATRKAPPSRNQISVRGSRRCQIWEKRTKPWKRAPAKQEPPDKTWQLDRSANKQGRKRGR